MCRIKVLVPIFLALILVACVSPTPAPSLPEATESLNPPEITIPSSTPQSVLLPGISNKTGGEAVPTRLPDPSQLKPIDTPAGTKPGGDNIHLEPAETLTWQPAPGDEKLQRGNVFLDQQEIITLESNPPQFILSLAGSMPTPCHVVRAKVEKSDAQNRLLVEVYSLARPEKICIQVLAPFTLQIPLEISTPGKYTVWVNGEKVGEVNR